MVPWRPGCWRACPNLPPAPYKPLAIGTVLDYGWWKCKVEAGDAFETVCVDRGLRARFFGKFIVLGEQDKDGYGGATSEAPIHGQYGQTYYLSVPAISLTADARRSIRALWPLVVGKRARFVLKHGSDRDDRIEVAIEVSTTERRSVAGREHEVYVVRAKSGFYANRDTADIEGGGIDGGRRTDLDLPPYSNEQTWWYDPVDGIVVQAKLVWEDFPIAGFGHDYELIRARFPQGTAPVAAPHPMPAPVAAPHPMPARSPSVAENRYGVAVIIGNKTYKGRTPAVDFAHNDAAAMKRFVVERLGYRPGNIIDLRDVGKSEIETVFGNRETHKGRLFDWVRAGKSDVVVFYSGHGVPGLDDRRGYLLPVDGDPNLARITGYPVDLLYDNLAKIPARSVTVYLDACFSGDSPKGMIVRATSGISVTPRMPKAGSKLTVLTAASANQVANWDEETKHGLFTRYLLEALGGVADGKEYGDQDGRVTLAEVKRYLDDEMTYQSQRRYGHARRQTASMQGAGGVVLATYSPGGTAPLPVSPDR